MPGIENPGIQALDVWRKLADFTPSIASAADDGANPRTITIRAYGNISGGVFVLGSSTSNTVGSQAASYATGDILGVKDASGANFIGVALNYIGSNDYGTIARQGVIIALADDTVTAGYPVICAGGNGVMDFAGTGSQDDY